MLGDRGRTGDRQLHGTDSVWPQLAHFCKQCAGVCSFHLHTGRGCFLNAMRSEKALVLRLGFVPRPQSSRASSLVSVDSFADAICATGACRLTHQTRQRLLALHLGRGFAPSTLYFSTKKGQCCHAPPLYCFRQVKISFTLSKKLLLFSYSLPVELSSNCRSRSFCLSLSLRGISTRTFTIRSPLFVPCSCWMP